MVWRNPEDELEIECVELRDEEENGDAEDGHPPLEAGQGVPGKLDPSMRRKLTKEPLDLPSECWNLVKASPVVGLHAEVSEGVHSEDGSTTIADDDVKDPMIPPALGEVRKLMFETVLQELKDDGDDGRQPPVSEYQGLTPVSHQMGNNEDINLVLEISFRKNINCFR